VAPRARPVRPSRELLVAGHVNVDHFLRIPAFPRADRTVPVLAERVELGGTATHIALVARAHGVQVGLLSRVGDRFPPPFRRRLAAAGIDLRGLRQVRGTPTPTCTILEPGDAPARTLIQQGPMASAAGAALPGRWWRSYRWLHLGTGDPRYYLRLARAASGGRQHVALDPAQEIFYRWDRATFRAILPHAELLFGNRAEVERAVALAGARDPPGLLRQLALVVRTEGAGGATAFYRGGSVHVAARAPRRTRTLIGAGDAFRGGFYGAWFAGGPLARCLAAGHRAALARIEGRA
jgi:nucleoside kinase